MGYRLPIFIISSALVIDSKLEPVSCTNLNPFDFFYLWISHTHTIYLTN